MVDSPDGAAALSVLDIGRLPRGWVVRQGCWGDPSMARNEGLAATGSPWVVFWDADNVMPEGFLAAVYTRRSSVRIRTSGLFTLTSNTWTRTWKTRLCGRFRTAITGGCAEGNCVDTASAWRRQALKLCGGWPYGFGAFEDYALVLELTRRGWPTGTERVRRS